MFAAILKASAKDTFVSNFMKNPKWKAKFPDQKQRLAVAFSYYERGQKAENDETPMYAKVLKAGKVGNPFHDANGRFSSKANAKIVGFRTQGGGGGQQGGNVSTFTIVTDNGKGKAKKLDPRVRGSFANDLGL